jgi:hypothetical protein
MTRFSYLSPIARCRRNAVSAEKNQAVPTTEFQLMSSVTKSDSELYNLVATGSSERRMSKLQILELQTCHDSFKTSSVLCTNDNTSMALVARRQADPTGIVTALASTMRVECAIVLECGFTDDMARQTALALARGCRLLSALILPHNRITSVGIRHLSAGLLVHAALHTLDLSGNACGDHGSESLAVLVCSSPALRVLNLRSNGIGPAGARTSPHPGPDG